MEKETEVDAQYIKNFCKERGITFKELGDEIGYSDSTIRGAISQNNISKQLATSILLYKENLILKKEIKKLREAAATFKDFFK